MSSSEDISRWDTVADAYADAAGQEQDSFFRRAEPAFRAAIPSPTGQRILDVGCGHGWLSRRYAELGAEVVGIDGSRRLIDKARARPSSVEWVVHDLDTGLPPGIGRFDAAIAHMVLMDLSRLSPLLNDVQRLLKPGGVLVAAILHPAFFNQKVQRADDAWFRQVTSYLTPQRWWIDSFGGHWHYHRPLEFYIGELSAAGFVMTSLSEPRSLPHDQLDEVDWSEYQKWFADIPTMLVIEAEKR
ncbi:class I SAM-dependent methyltransferase [Nesterenkonia muleiensis]|uniref:class I SAM-dependent methyltransferase n=1 Tax=Nesterenkonia muleiensis TaxID=2282648 RepID=UPI0013001959|nr:class I SAM-dependent methyltransferase [Nesterenkonia muleiensis]